MTLSNKIMAVKNKNDTKEEIQIDQIEDLLNSKDFKGMHYGSRSGEEITKPDMISTGSLFFDSVLGGGYRSSGWARFYAEPECGKSSMSLCWGKNWQDFYPKDGMVIVFNAEGRITQDLVERSGISTDKNRFRIIDTNMSEAIWGLTEKLILNNPDKKKYFFIVDSTDACVRSADSQEKKEIGEAEKIGGGATILSAAGKRLSLLFNLTGHFMFMTSQVRDKVNTHGPGGGGKDASGGNAPKFYSSLTGEIKKAWTDTYIYEFPSDKKSKIIGRMVQIKLHKTPNEKTGIIVEYPVKYGKIGGVWREYEAMMLAQAFGLVIQKGSIFEFDESFYAQMTKDGIEANQKYRGEKNIRDEFDSNPKLAEYIIDRTRALL